MEVVERVTPPVAKKVESPPPPKWEVVLVAQAPLWCSSRLHRILMDVFAKFSQEAVITLRHAVRHQVTRVRVGLTYEEADAKAQQALAELNVACTCKTSLFVSFVAREEQ